MNNLLKQKIIFGTASLNLKYGIYYDRHATEATFLLDEIYNQQIMSFDTAIEYKNDKILGSFLKKINYKATIYSKTDINLEFKELTSLISRHFDNLGMVPHYFLLRSNDKIDINLFHKIIEYFHNNYPNIKLGASIYEKEDFLLFKNLMFKIFQFPYNIFNNQIFNKKKNDIFIARSIFLQGLLIVNKKIILKKKNTADYLNNFIKEYFLFIKKNNVSPIDVCLNYVMLNKQLNNIIVSANNIQQLEKIINFKPLDMDIINHVSHFLSNYNNQILDPRNWA